MQFLNIIWQQESLYVWISCRANISEKTSEKCHWVQMNLSTNEVTVSEGARGWEVAEPPWRSTRRLPGSQSCFFTRVGVQLLPRADPSYSCFHKVCLFVECEMASPSAKDIGQETPFKNAPTLWEEKLLLLFSIQFHSLFWRTPLFYYDRGWDVWMASPMRWTWVWVGSRSWWWTGKPGVLQSTGSQRVGHNWVTKLNWLFYLKKTTTTLYLANTYDVHDFLVLGRFKMIYHVG